MVKYITAKEFRINFTEIIEKIKEGITLIIVKRSKPVAKITSINETSDFMTKDLLAEVSKNPQSAPSLNEINSIIHKLRKKHKK